MQDTFPCGTIVSVVDFAKNYTLQPQNEIQSQYYHSEQVSLMVHITYRHGLNSSEEQREILKEYHFYISDDSTMIGAMTSTMYVIASSCSMII